MVNMLTSEYFFSKTKICKRSIAAEAGHHILLRMATKSSADEKPGNNDCRSAKYEQYKGDADHNWSCN